MNRENSKREKYSSFVPSSSFFPLIFSTFGRFGNEGIKFIQNLCKEIFDNHSGPYDSSAASLTYSLIDQLLISIHKGNAMVTKEALAYARRGIRNQHYPGSNNQSLDIDQEDRAGDPCFVVE